MAQQPASEAGDHQQHLQAVSSAPGIARQDGLQPFKYATLTGVSGALQTKNMSSGFMKEDRNSYWNRRKADTNEVVRDIKEAKRRRLALAAENGTSSLDGDGLDSSGRSTSPFDAKGKGREMTVGPLFLFEIGFSDAFEVTQGTAQLVDPAKVVVIHPGSRTLRIGRSTDALPFEIPNVIARRLRSGKPISARKPYRELSDDQMDILKHGVKERMKILKLRGTTGGSQAAKEYNEGVKPVQVQPEADDFPIHWIESSDWTGKETYFGEDALRLDDPDGNGWQLRWPFSSGNFDARGYRSAKELLSDVQAILTDAIESKCEISRKSFEECSAIFVIPDLYDDTYLAEMCTMLLGDMGFAQIVLQQVSSLLRSLAVSADLSIGGTMCNLCSRSAICMCHRYRSLVNIDILYR